MDMENFILNLNARFTDDEKEACLPDIEKACDLALLAREKGLLAFEDVMQDEKNILLKRALAMAVDGIDRYSIEHCLQMMILCNGYSGEALLRNLIYATGVGQIYYGYTPDIIRIKLMAMLGRKYMKQHIYTDKALEERNKEIDEFKNNIGKYMPQDKEVDFEDLILRMNHCSIQRVIRELDEWKLAKALKGVRSQKAWEAIFDNLSKNRQLNFISILNRFKDLKPNKIQEAQTEITEFIKKMEDEGEIIINWK